MRKPLMTVGCTEINRDKLIDLLQKHREYAEKSLYYAEIDNETESNKWDDEMHSIEVKIMDGLGIMLDSYGEISNEIQST